MADRSSNGEFNKYQRDDAEDKSRVTQDKDEKDSQVDKAGEYVRELLQEKLEIDTQKWPNALRLLDQEIQKTQAIGKPLKDHKYVDIYREKPIRVAVKVLVPVREHPKFNFVGKLLGPKGNTMKRLQEETMCKMAVLGRGSMKDRQKEEECRQSLDAKYSHLSDDLHVEIASLAPPAEAHARIAFALAEIRKYLIPDNNDTIRQEQMREMEYVGEDGMIMEERRPPPGMRPPGILRPAVRPPPGMPPRQARPILPPPPARGPPITRPVPAKAKVFSILDRARAAMDQSYGEEMYQQPPGRYQSYEYEDETLPHASHEYYEAPEYPDESSSRAWKSYKTTTTAGTGARYRTAPYTRPSKPQMPFKQPAYGMGKPGGGLGNM
ncbi:KH domain-containing, RNA-binding, signal transduction-associated protein 3-like [Belonocnema kinseyi]|uniref:KH domain-containing, RNA-binding, signal transduction-associated protein 3-like n=1 Tax=Belonocnema kinseyi TaxID=2817044 RepID=UPI00143D6588|nr:KH domain-containing, RNA-binding, signal transduction-associated protein 3-like [Belonocnema kinseyi]